eukprot:Pgem_evm1s19805
MRINVERVGSEKEQYVLADNDNATVLHLKQLIFDKHDIPVDNQKLLLNGK